MDLALRLGRLDVDAMLTEISFSQWIEWIDYLYPDHGQTPQQMLAIMQTMSHAHNR